MVDARLRWLGACGLASPVVVTLAWVVAGAVEHGIDVRDGDLSDLGSLVARPAWVWNVPLSVSGALLAAFGVGLVLALEGPLGRIGAAAVAVSGIGDLTDGFLRLDCARGAPCREASRSWHDVAHDVESTITVLAFLGGLAILALAFRRSGLWRPLALPSAAALVACTLLALAYTTRDGETWAGVLQRAFVSVSGLWTLGTAWFLIRVAGGARAYTRA